MTLPSTSDDYGCHEDSEEWTVAAVFGAISLLVGLLLVMNTEAAMTTLVLLIAMSLMVSGLCELLLTDERSLSTWIIASTLIVGGLILLLWPNITLWALAVVAGVSLVLTGAAQIITAIGSHQDLGYSLWGMLGGAVTLLAGIAAVAWPQATAVVIAFIFGVRVLMWGVLLLMAAHVLRRRDKNADPTRSLELGDVAQERRAQHGVVPQSTGTTTKKG